MGFRRIRSQSAVEYVFLVAGALLFAVFVLVVLRGGIFTQGAHRVGEQTNSFLTNYGQKYLCFDNFDAEVLDRYEVVSGSWGFNDRKLAASTAQEGLVLSDCSLSNFSLSVWLKRPNDGGSVSIIFRARNATDHYNLTVGESNLLLEVYPGGADIGSSVGHDGSLANGLTVVLNASGDRFWVWVNGALKIDGVQDASYSYSAGLAGFYSSSGGSGYSEFDDLKACETPCPS